MTLWADYPLLPSPAAPENLAATMVLSFSQRAAKHQPFHKPCVQRQHSSRQLIPERVLRALQNTPRSAHTAGLAENTPLSDTVRLRAFFEKTVTPPRNTALTVLF